MFFKGHFQNAYVTHDMDRAMAQIDARFGKIDWIVFEPDMVLKTPQGDRASSVRAALGWQAGHQLELIQPVKGYLDHYTAVMRADPADWRPVFHHVAVRRDDEAAMRREIEELGFPVLFESAVPGLAFVYIDARETLGHCIEFIWATPEGWEMQGWPKDRPVY